MWLCASTVQTAQPCPVGIYKGRFMILWVYKDKSRHGKTMQWLSIPPSIKAKVHATVFNACMTCPPPAPHAHMHRPGRSFPSLFTWPYYVTPAADRPCPRASALAPFCLELSPLMCTWLTPPLPSDFHSAVTFSGRPSLAYPMSIAIPLDPITILLNFCPCSMIFFLY